MPNTQKNFEKKRMINIIDVLMELLNKAYFIVISMIIFAIILGAYKYSKDVADIKNIAINKTDNTNGLDSVLTEEENNQLNSAIKLKKRIAERNKYIQDSIYFNLDMDNENITINQYVIESPNTAAVSDSFSIKQYVSSGALATDMIENGIDLKQEHLRELLKYEDVNSITTTVNTNVQYVQEINTFGFSVKVIGTDEKTSAEWAKVADKCIKEYAATTFMSGDILTLKSAKTSVIRDEVGIKYITDYLDAIQLLNDRYAKITDKFSDVQNRLLNNSEESVDVEEVQTQENIKATISKKFVLLGAIIGAFLSAMVLIIIYIFRGTVNIPEEYIEIFGVNVFGDIKNIKDKKKKLQIASISVSTTLKKKDIKNILVLTDKYTSQEAVEVITDKLSAEKINYVCKNEIVSLLEECKDKPEYSNVIILSTLKKSKFAEMSADMNLFTAMNIEVDGVVLC